MFPRWMDEAFRLGGGQISLEEFMRLALYDAEHGYYSTRIKTVGRHGDFSTSATLDSALGEAIANWGKCGSGRLIEIGAGDGSLAEQVLTASGWWRRRRMRYHIVDTSAGLISKQRERLSGFGSLVQWHTDVGEALQACGGEADLFSNELVDAFPASVLRWDAGSAVWEELFVRADGTEISGPSEFSCGWQPADGQRIERHLSYRAWLEGWVGEWKSGRMLTIDYGGTFPELYARRPAGTLRAYFAQMRFDGIGEFLQRAGAQDLTADVNFSDLMGWGQALGLGEGQLLTQRDFLLQNLAGLEARAKRQEALAFLLAPGGAADAFQVLEQCR
ncbi:MAG: SAM-dependent methyltransferase [Verrucomicrobiales bacterium]